MIDRAIRVYLFAQEKLAEVRYGGNAVQDLREVVRALMNMRLMV